MPALRNEDYVAFLDESGEYGFWAVGGVLIPARWLRSAERRWRDFVRDHLGSRSGRVEVKARELLKGEGVSLHAQTVLGAGGRHLSAQGAGRQFYRDALEHIAGIAEVRILSVGLETQHQVDAYRLWYWMMNAVLVERRTMPRPRLPLTVIDGQDATLRAAQDLVTYRFYRAFPRCQPYVGRGDKWFVGGSVHQDSRLHPFIQMADLVASAARHSIRENAPFDAWYGTHLVGEARARHRSIDVSSHAIAQLRRRSRHDACGSGWESALIAR